MQPIKEKVKDFFEIAKKQFQTKNLMASPRIVKVVISVGTGKMTRKDQKRSKLVAERLAVITGQKPASRGAKKSIASYKLREGEPIGLMVTLHGKRMYEFLDRLFNITIPRMRDFRGFDKKSIDEMGNITLGIKEHNIFPETADEELKDVFGLSVTIVTTARTREEATAFFEFIGVRFKKEKKNETQ